jgi:hypothetical protein
MAGREDLLPEARYGPEVERGATTPPRSTAAALIGGAVLGLAAAVQENRLSRRERLVSTGGALVSLGLGLVSAVYPLSLTGIARIAPRAFALGCFGTAATSTAVGGGDRTPAYFPAILLTALGGGVGGDAATGARAGTAVGLAYLGGCAHTLKPWEGRLAREAWWVFAGALGFVGAGIVGAIAGDLNLKMRALTDFTEREEETVSRSKIEEATRLVHSHADALLRLLAELDRSFGETPGISTATTDLATALGSLKSVRTILPEENSLATLDRLVKVCRPYNETDGNVSVGIRGIGDTTPSADAATTDAVCECATALIQNAGNARRPGRPRVEANITLEVVGARDRRRMLRMAVEDDAGGRVDDLAEWGKGLRASRAAALELGGDFRIEQGDRGLRLIFEAPFVDSAEPGVELTTFQAEAARGRDSCLRVLRAITGGQSVFILLSNYGRRGFAWRLGVVGSLLASGEWIQRLPESRRVLAAAPLSILAMSAFRGPGRPPLGGWSCVLCAQVGSSGRPGLGWFSAGAATAGAVLAAGPERFGAAMQATIADRTFSIIGGLVGFSVWKGLGKLRDQEQGIADEAWRRQALSELEAPQRQIHHLLKPVEDAFGPDGWDAFSRTELGAGLLEAEDDLGRRTSDLAALLTKGDPLRQLQHQLARMLAPAPVRLLGARPMRTSPEHQREIEAVRYRIGLIGLGLAIALRVRDYLPTSKIFFVEQLQELQIHVGEADLEHTRLTVVQVPFRASRHDSVDAVLAEASRKVGGRVLRRSGRSFEVHVHNTAFG